MVQLVSGEFFEVLRQRARAGRLIEPRDNTAPGANPVMVISDALLAAPLRSRTPTSSAAS